MVSGHADILCDPAKISKIKESEEYSLSRENIFCLFQSVQSIDVTPCTMTLNKGDQRRSRVANSNEQPFLSLGFEPSQ